MDKLDLIVGKIDDLKVDMKDDLDEIKSDINSINHSIIEMEIDLRKNADDIRYHIKRTDLTDESVALLKEELNALKQKLTVEHLLKLIVAVAAGLSTIAGCIYAVMRLVEKLV